MEQEFGASPSEATTGLSSLRDEAAKASSPKASIPCGFTAGPWQTKNDYVPDCLTVIANVDGEIVDGTTHYTYDFIATCEDEFGEASLDAVANARLIAAAPDLLEALEKIERITGGASNLTGESVIASIARAAIACATVSS